MSFWASAVDRMKRTIRDVFGISVVYVYKEGGTETVLAIFDKEYEIADFNDDGQPISVTAPVLTVRDDDLKRAPLKGDTVLIALQKYRIEDAQPDGLGMTRCLLVKVNA